jgi:hypothetical protein
MSKAIEQVFWIETIPGHEWRSGDFAIHRTRINSSEFSGDVYYVSKRGRNFNYSRISLAHAQGLARKNQRMKRHAA